MRNRSNLTLSTSPLSQPARNPRETACFTRRQRSLYGRKQHHSTGKERDTETGLYYYGARYLDSKTSRWLSGDPAVGDYVPEAPVDDGARKRNGNLPGQGGVFNYVNLHLYHYAGNNPVKYVDPDGEWLALKARLDRIGSDINTIVRNSNNKANPFNAKGQAYQDIKNEVNSGSFKREAGEFARSELNKTDRQINTWAENEQTRLDALLTIRDKSESKYDDIMKEVTSEYEKAYKGAVLDERGKSIRNERIKRDIADKAANQKLDELIKKELPSHEIQDN